MTDGLDPSYYPATLTTRSDCSPGVIDPTRRQPTMIVTVTPNPGLDRTLTVPRLLFNRVTRATSLQLDWGGKGFNVSRALKALGIESLAMGFVGGATGRMLAQGLVDLGISTDFVYIADETRTNIVIAESNEERHIKVNEAGPTVRATELTAFLDLASDRVRPGDVWVFCGSLPPGVPSDFYARLIALVQAAGARAFLDTSGEPLRLGCAAQPYLVKPNALEVEEITGRKIRSKAHTLDAAGFVLAQGVELAAISLGVDGLLLASEHGAVWARPPAVQARNAVGAGDALVAGIIWALTHELPLDQVARWGVACGTASAMRKGVNFGTYDEAKALYRQVQIELPKLGPEGLSKPGGLA
jgi:1-phosphofructokinase